MAVQYLAIYLYTVLFCFSELKLNSTLAKLKLAQYYKRK